MSFSRSTPSTVLVNKSAALSVSELNRQVRHLLEVSFLQVWVEGEISGLSRPSSGHWYFTLKDSKAQVKCAMFKGANLTVRFQPKEGDQILVKAKVSLFEGRGDFQLIVDTIEPAGQGALQREFEALKARLMAEGLFAEARKRALPAIPRHIGVVTSPTGAAIHDILTVLKRRCPAIPVTLYPTAVQGKQATAEIVKAIEAANRHGLCDLLIVGRGGGSLEDLWCFNEEAVARAIVASQIPVVSAVGHEVDFTIADFAADLRAATPSAAAESVSPDQAQWLLQLASLEARLAQRLQRLLREKSTQLAQLATRLRDPRQQLAEQAQRLDDAELRLARLLRNLLQVRQNQLQQLTARLAVQSPQARIKLTSENLAQLDQALQLQIKRALEQGQQALHQTAARLHLISPLATLGRGYSLLQDQQGNIIRKASQVRIGAQVTARLGEGRLHCQVIQLDTQAQQVLFE